MVVTDLREMEDLTINKDLKEEEVTLTTRKIATLSQRCQKFIIKKPIPKFKIVKANVINSQQNYLSFLFLGEIEK